MRRIRPLKVLKVLVIVAIAIGATGLSVMTLWNWLVPGLTGWHTLGFAQALGLFVLCRLLFGGLRGGGGRFGQRMRERWQAMSPEERARVREALRRRCGHGPQPTETAP